ncbi:MAG: dUTP diphosphatase [Porticoccaceae bacterium]|nr:dUTP diphosphatase [Porticoccaceae bacterium]|tara:strand:+ start:1602 stop:2240 length:639 start_codon:yes stop_codon:yes gene_type:complete
MQEKIMIMLTMQEAMNTKVHSNWRDRNFAWYRAIWIECAELLDHHGWKWWKKQELNRGQMLLELIDIWHFGLSLLLARNAKIESISATLEQELSNVLNSDNFRVDLEIFVSHTLETKDFDVAKFACLMRGIDMSFEDLYVGYVGKNVLNFFRQDHGYKDGSYRKVWGDLEDNEHLMRIVKELDVNSLTFNEDLYHRLEKTYMDNLGFEKSHP